MEGRIGTPILGWGVCCSQIHFDLCCENILMRLSLKSHWSKKQCLLWHIWLACWIHYFWPGDEYLKTILMVNGLSGKEKAQQKLYNGGGETENSSRAFLEPLPLLRGFPSALIYTAAACAGALHSVNWSVAGSRLCQWKVQLSFMRRHLKCTSFWCQALIKRPWKEEKRNIIKVWLRGTTLLLIASGTLHLGLIKRTNSPRKENTGNFWLRKSTQFIFPQEIIGLFSIEIDNSKWVKPRLPLSHLLHLSVERRPDNSRVLAWGPTVLGKWEAAPLATDGNKCWALQW